MLSELPHESLVNCDAASLLLNFHAKFDVTEQDVIDSNALAKRVGSQWEQVLRRRGYVDYAEIVLELVEKSEFLEGHNEEAEQMEVLTRGNNNPIDSYATIDAALNSIHRYQSCHETGHPLDSDSNGLSSARTAIQQIDRLMEGIGSEKLKARYGYDWDAINEAVKRNEKRLHASQRSNDDVEDEYQIVPRSLDRIDDTDIDDTQQAVRFEEDQNKSVDTDFLISTNVHTANTLSRKRKREAKLQNNVDNVEVLRGRAPSNIGETQWAWQDILDEIPVSERKRITTNCIHPPFPPADGSEAEEAGTGSPRADGSTNDEEHTAIICGALRQFGSTHLWEQTAHIRNKQSFSASKKSAMRQAMKERARPRDILTSEKKSEINDEVGGKKNRSKTKWTEGIVSNSPRLNDDYASDEDNQTTQQQSRRWLEMDIGECTIELTNSSPNEETAEVPTKEMLAFRSLEMALKF